MHLRATTCMFCRLLCTSYTNDGDPKKKPRRDTNGPATLYSQFT